MNAEQDWGVDRLRQSLTPGTGPDVASPSLLLFFWEELASALAAAAPVRAAVPQAVDDLGLRGNTSDRAARNRLQAAHLARTLVCTSGRDSR